LRCLEKDRATRFQNVAELAKALLPFAPERCRASVARIIRIVEAPGVNTASLSLPPSGRASTGAHATSVSVHTSNPRRNARGVALALAIAAAAVGVTQLGGWLQSKPNRGPTTPINTAENAPVGHAAQAQLPPAVVSARAVEPVPLAAASAESPVPPPAASAESPVPPASSATQSPARSHASARVGVGRPSAGLARPTAPTLSPSSAASSVPSAAFPVASAPQSPPGPATAPAGEPTTSSSPKWIVDIVEKRKAKGGASP
jgi:hypothetical protein